MFTVKEFVAKFENYSDDELFEIHSNWNNYSEEAREAFNIVIAGKGGVESLLERHALKLKFLEEAGKIRKAAIGLCMEGKDVAFAKKMVTSNLLPRDGVDKIIDAAYHVTGQQIDDVKIKPRTIYGSILGGIVASIVSGVLWGVLLIYSERILLALLIAPALISYWIIKAFTKQSKNNIVVLIATIIAVCVAMLIGQGLFKIMGFRGISSY